MPWNDKRGRNNNKKRRRNSNNNGNNYNGGRNNNNSGKQAAKQNKKRVQWLDSEIRKLDVDQSMMDLAPDLKSRIKAALEAVPSGLLSKNLIRENSKPFSIHTNPRNVPLIFKAILSNLKSGLNEYPLRDPFAGASSTALSHISQRFTNLDTAITAWQHATHHHLPLLKRLRWQMTVETIQTVLLKFCDREIDARLKHKGPKLFRQHAAELTESVESMDTSIIWQTIMEALETVTEENHDPDDPVDLILASHRHEYLGDTENSKMATYQNTLTTVVRLFRQRQGFTSLFRGLLNGDDIHKPFHGKCEGANTDDDLAVELRECHNLVVEQMKKFEADTQAYSALRKAGFLPSSVILTFKDRGILKVKRHRTQRFQQFDFSKFEIPDQLRGWHRTIRSSVTTSLKAIVNKTDTHQAKKAKPSQNNKSQRNSQNSNRNRSNSTSTASLSSNSYSNRNRSNSTSTASLSSNHYSSNATTATAPAYAVTAYANTSSGKSKNVSQQCKKCLRTNHTTQNCRYKEPCNRCRGYHGPKGPCRCRLCNRYHLGQCKQNK